MQALGTQIAYFEINRMTLAKENHGKFVLIHDESIAGFYKSELDAYTVAKQNYEAGSFLIRKCLTPEEETPQVFHSRAI
jgi:hypothetical protein